MAWHSRRYQHEQSLENGVPKRPEDFRSESRSMTGSENSGDCPCGSTVLCTGPRGGQYCLNPNGKKKYIAQ